MSKHTPGPWHANTPAEDRYADGARVRAADGEIVAVSQLPNIANARLIAACPDLLAACRAFLAEVGPHDTGLAIVARQARAAIRKATGE